MSDDYGFENKTSTELRKIVADIVEDNIKLSHDKKEYVAGINGVIKENVKRMEAAVESIKTRTAHEQAAELEAKASAILAGKGL